MVWDFGRVASKNHLKIYRKFYQNFNKNQDKLTRDKNVYKCAKYICKTFLIFYKKIAIFFDYNTLYTCISINKFHVLEGIRKWNNRKVKLII